ncbi:MAG: helix-turn-helix transcriptional regulator [Candidatus Paceibacterota bacterium]|jgi:transcriptional regulator with XRE-family HTH domain
MSNANQQFISFLGKKIKAEREKLGLTQEGLGKKLKMHRTYVGMVERGEKNISVVSLRRFAEALGLTLRDIIDF